MRELMLSSMLTRVLVDSQLSTRRIRVTGKSGTSYQIEVKFFWAVRRFECSDLTVQIVMKGLCEVHQQEREVSTPVQRGVEFRSTAQRCPAQYAGNRSSVKQKDASCKTQTCTWSVY
jgi:hypothetical protein